MMSLDIWPVCNWAKLEKDLRESSFASVNPETYISEIDAEMTDSMSIIFKISSILEKIKQKCPLKLAGDLTEIFITPFEVGFDDLSARNIDSGNWSFVNSSLNPMTVHRLHQLSMQVDMKGLELYFQPTEEFDFEIFSEYLAGWLQILREADNEGCGLLIAHF